MLQHLVIQHCTHHILRCCSHKAHASAPLPATHPRYCRCHCQRRWRQRQSHPHHSGLVPAQPPPQAYMTAATHSITEPSTHAWPCACEHKTCRATCWARGRGCWAVLCMAIISKKSVGTQAGSPWTHPRPPACTAGLVRGQHQDHFRTAWKSSWVLHKHTPPWCGTCVC